MGSRTGCELTRPPSLLAIRSFTPQGRARYRPMVLPNEIRRLGPHAAVIVQRLNDPFRGRDTTGVSNRPSSDDIATVGVEAGKPAAGAGGYVLHVLGEGIFSSHPLPASGYVVIGRGAAAD